MHIYWKFVGSFEGFEKNQIIRGFELKSNLVQWMDQYKRILRSCSKAVVFYINIEAGFV